MLKGQEGKSVLMHVAQGMLAAYFMPEGLGLLSPCPCLVLLPSVSPLVKNLFSMRLLYFKIFTSVLHFLDSSYK